MSENTISKSQAKRKARQEEVRKHKQEAQRNRLIGSLTALVLVGLFIFAIGSFIYTSLIQTSPSSDYGAMLNEDGTLKDINPADYIETPDYKSLSVARADVTFTEEELDAEIESLLSQHQTMDTDSGLTIRDGDTVNIDYVGTVDGVAFEGGDTQGTGADLTIGSGQYVDTFEDQLIGAHPTDQVTVNVTFPADYVNEDLQGKAAVFEVTINGIYTTPEFNDAFVLENLSENASTAEEYRAYLKETREKENLKAAIEALLQSGAKATGYNEEHIKYLKGISKYEQQTYYESYNQMYYSMMGSYPYSSFEEYMGMSSSEFEDYLETQAQSQAALDMTYQYIFTDAGLTITDADYEEKVNAIGTTSADSYGKGYIMQMIMKDKVIEYLTGIVTVSENEETPEESTQQSFE